MRADSVKLRTEMYKKRLSQAEISAKTGISRNTINNICTGKPCSFESLAKVADVLEIDPRGLISLEE
jgi:transcriptional regulator with XRE-family HTH domain